ncbi:MAG: glycine--tRNA ligase [Parcubacteria group bacterium CG1_02_40_82]|uniref:Glycine--tRNA ligase n=4 Tax=Candidatus Portnoyibacteriota TaxID=1817913 RepID=A0A2M7IHK9_9BACT|nr:MAG: glycine--tRNA ligase [Parcubacteria group bacterium CG1_02_40_82]PIQ75200.1 MAG: glycine--tRNA ligase [Candidatus Portnoybacteria bacterium CG11_big_fil_rev_8_21_14_0_20_40_15]PIS31432.1 MAG: glycine--tRNA ligase [Candidatus Portnoybacteria bacterium CG08_land_8_20_14_0_20_40_83]PIW75938.1 MAG: glycine--tRNA ligase [Candidatus Portnoybacteria bacterium CG_4_8_14_3_um_filter_40_10]PIY75226.1 MAG: glycine--tRNA ligase [Candidatus Portnoybacteria bacterium CG_4_10_14_0_8_um_filter_40_50]P
MKENNLSADRQDLMEKIVSLCKRRGFIYPGSEIYGGLANTYDYGPLGAELKNNIKQLWWKYFVQSREDMIGMDGGVLLNPKVWEASGHLKKFKDALVECKKCHHRFRSDKLAGSKKCPDCGGEFTEPKLFSGMFKTVIGPVEEEGLATYLRPETAQNMFINFKNILDSTSRKIPFGIGQTGKSFRNEITMGNFFFRTIEFEIMELEYFIAPDSDWNKIFEQWLDYIYGFADLIGLNRKNFYNNELGEKERAHYSKRTIDIEYKFPWGSDELWAIAYRTDYDLSAHQKMSGKNLEYFDEETKKKFIPHVIEPTFGTDRTMLAVLVESYSEEKGRVVLKLKPKVAPYKAAVFPLLANKPQLAVLAKKIYDDLRKDFMVAWDDRGNIGKRYYSQDEIGTPFCITVDFDSLEKQDVTVRDRDTTKQERIKIGELKSFLEEKLK